MKDHATGRAVWRDGRLALLEADAYHRALAALKLGDGEEVVIRVSRPEDAYTYGQIKFYFGQVVTPFSEATGYHKHEAHLMLKAECMPEGKTSLTELSHDELRDYTLAAEQTAREWCPEAFLLYEPPLAHDPRATRA